MRIHGSLFVMLALGSGCKDKASRPPTTPVALTDSATAVAPPPAEVPAAPPAEAKPVMIDFSSADKATHTYFAGYPVNFTGDWKALHDKLKTEATRLTQPNPTYPKPSGKIELYVYDISAHVPDLEEITDGSMFTREHLIALYDNTLTGSWRFCFGGVHHGSTMTKCIADTDAVTPTLYDPATVEAE